MNHLISGFSVVELASVCVGGSLAPEYREPKLTEGYFSDKKKSHLWIRKVRGRAVGTQQGGKPERKKTDMNTKIP